MFKTVKKHWRQWLVKVACTTILTSSVAITCNTASATVNTAGMRVYQNAPRLTEEHRQTLAEDINRFKEADDLWDVLRDEFSIPHYENNALVQEKIEFYMNNQDFLLRSVSRAAPYLYYILEQVKSRHLPAELVLLPIVESGYNPLAISNMGASGIWQLMPSTATGLGIKQDWWYDGRRDVVTSTRAALDYLAYLQSFFDGNWLLAMAAYNTGEGNVLAAIRRNIRDGRDTDFWSLPVASQTKNYVPSILALAVIISNPKRYPIYFPSIRYAPYLAQFNIKKQLNLKQAATLAGINYKKLLRLNPGISRPKSKRGYRLVLPIENVEQFAENLMHAPRQKGDTMDWKHYRMRSGDTLRSVAKKFKTTASDIRKMNHLSKSIPRRGTNLLIPISKTKHTTVARSSKKSSRHHAAKKSKHKTATHSIAARVGKKLNTAKNTPQHKISPLKDTTAQSHPANKNVIAAKSDKPKAPSETVYKVKRGDTIAKIAKHFKTSPASIRLANLIDDSMLLEGSNLVIPLPMQG